MHLDPLTRRQLARFRSTKRGWYSALILVLLIASTAVTELLVNNRALVVNYQGEWHFPTYADFKPGSTFGLDYAYETNYRELQASLAQSGDGFVIMPPVPFSPYEINSYDGLFAPHPPSAAQQHYLGTDTAGRDVLARLAYGFRIAIWFSLVLLVATFVVGIAVGCAMGYYGGVTDLIGQRVIEVWSNVPMLYIIIIIASVITPDFWILMGLLFVFGWMGMTWYMRTATYREAARDYVLAAKSLGASDSRIIFRHILPNTLSLIVTFIPFAVTGGIGSLTSLDYLGYGLPPPTPSWGELLKQGTDNLDSAWIVTSVVTALVGLLVMVTFVGEAIRDAFDPKQHTTYE
ncbi:ABC transporter permease subunit [Litorivicinus lipolyticus]|uniref:ABC transporter permease subunit n=2 Tax=Litorivicinus lipolyticus TaxID=418701 RepID=A0A5Q2QJM2_9GAMM|nr:ABC transporter permease [Litorivicinus lipolyticus]QGG81295.1 ABC transporter permease subunit [Litorivicinus lipolyticus]